MDNYKFGNLLCSLREEHNLTQREFAKILDVSDKAVSKWENGQAIPRMDTLEKIAETFETTVEDLIISSKDNIKRIFVKNSFGTTLHFQLDDEIISLKAEDDEKWIIVDANKESFNAVVYGELSMEEIIDEIDNQEKPITIKDKLVHRGMKKLSRWVDKQLRRGIINIKCSYTISSISDDQHIEVENEFFSIGDRMGIFKELNFSYPKLICNCDVKMTNADCLNKADVFADFRHQALTSELGISIPLMLLAYPFRKMYFKSVIKPKGLMKYLAKADYYVAKNEKQEARNKKRKHPALKTIGILILLVVAWFGIDIAFGIADVATDKPYLISADYSTIEYGREVYSRVDELPKGSIPETVLGAIVWDDARIDGFSKSDQYFDEHKVCEYTDKDGNTYLWLIMNYGDDAWDEETGEHKDYDDFTEHYVYKLQK